MKFIVEVPETEPKVSEEVLKDLCTKFAHAREMLRDFKLAHCVKVIHTTFKRSYPEGDDVLDMKVVVEIPHAGEFSSSEVIGIDCSTGVYERNRDVRNLVMKLVQECLWGAEAKHASALQQIPRMHEDLLKFSRQLRPIPAIPV